MIIVMRLDVREGIKEVAMSRGAQVNNYEKNSYLETDANAKTVKN